jgi:hypothetical protein
MQDAAPYDAIELCAETCALAQAVATLDLDYACQPEG